MSDHVETLRDSAAALRAPFDVVGKKPQNVDKNGSARPCSECNGYHKPASLHIDYVGHAQVRDRLYSVDPTWSWEPLAFGEDGRPLLERDPEGRPVGLWIRLGVCGVRKLGFGSCTPDASDPVKELIGDAIRNAALNFGVGLDLHIKTAGAPRRRRQQPPGEPRPAQKAADATPPAQPVEAPPPSGDEPAKRITLARLRPLARAAGKDIPDGITEAKALELIASLEANNEEGA